MDNCQPQVFAEKDLVSSEFWSRFSRNLLIDWIDSCLNNSSPRNKEIFFQWKRKNKRVWSLQRRGFYTLIETNARVTLTDMKNTNKTNKCSKKKKITVIQPDFNKLETGSALQKVVLKISRKASVVIYSSWFY